jgi:hypothetical protein
MHPETYGRIYFQSHSVGFEPGTGDDDRAKWATMVEIAPDFVSFILGLREVM